MKHYFHLIHEIFDVRSDIVKYLVNENSIKIDTVKNKLEDVYLNISSFYRNSIDPVTQNSLNKWCAIDCDYHSLNLEEKMLAYDLLLFKIYQVMIDEIMLIKKQEIIDKINKEFHVDLEEYSFLIEELKRKKMDETPFEDDDEF